MARLLCGGSVNYNCRLPSRINAGVHRVEAVGLVLSLWPDDRLAQDENPEAPAVKREAEEEWGKDRWR